MKLGLMLSVVAALLQGASSAPLPERNAVIASAPAKAVPIAPPVQMKPQTGLWAGRIDGRAARLCFDEPMLENYERGRIYFLGDPNIHDLGRQNAEQLFREQDNFSDLDATIRFELAGNGRLTVYRQFGGKTTRSQFTRLPVVAGGTGSCTSNEFLAPRLGGLPKKIRQLSLSGLGYTRYSYDPGREFDHVRMIGIALDGSQPGDARINAILHAAVTGWGSGDDYLSCSLHYFGTDRASFQFEHEAKVIYLSQRLVSVSIEYDGGCGGIHDSGIYYDLFDRKTGKAANLADWFAPGALKLEGDAYRSPYTPNPELLELIKPLAASPANDDILAYDLQNCDLLSSDERGWGDPPCAFALFLHQDGVGFVSYQQSVQMLPRGTVIIPWAKIKAFLTPQAWATLHPAG